MKSFSYIGLVGCVLLTLTASPPIRAQIRVGIETGITGHHIYRGLTLNQGATVTSAPYASYLIGSSTIAGGMWSTMGLSKPDLTKDVGFEETTFPETSAWLQVSHLVNVAEFTIGLSRHDVRTTGAAGPPENAADTWEIYAQAQTKPFEAEWGAVRVLGRRRR